MERVEFNHKTGKYLDVEGANIYYEVIENAGKPALLFLHGGFGNIEDFNTILPMLANDYHIVGIDSRGHGKSTLGTDKITYKRLQLDVEAIVNHLQLKDLSIIGFSDGGTIAYRLTVSNNISIKKIVTIGARWSLSDAEITEEEAANITPEEWIGYFEQNFDFYRKQNPSPDALKFTKCILEMWVDKTADGFSDACVENINVPVLAIRGNDDTFSLESIVKFTSKVQNSILFNIPFAPHKAFEKYPKFLVEVIRDFLNNGENRRSL